VSKDIFLSVIIPSYNEMANLRKGVLDKIDHFLKKQKYSYEVIIVDDGSTDGSEKFAQEFIKENNNFKLIKNQHLGKAGAVSAGMLAAIGENRLFTDMDQAAPIEELSKFMPFLNDYDIIIGSRNANREGAPWTRLIMARGMIILRTLLIGIRGIKDTQCGFKLFKAKSAEKLFTKIQNFHGGFKKISGSSVTAGFDVELLYIAQKMGYKIKEVPVSWLYVETRRVSPIKDSIEGVLSLLTIKINSLKGKYK
jgi:dolichyl-phosphate beta-glucosyltransferase